MARRKRIGLLYSYDERWIGGTYYVLNIINALSALPRRKQPIVTLFTEDAANLAEVQKITGYPFLKMHIVNKRLSDRLIFWNRVAKKLLGKSIFKWSPPKANVDIFYPKHHPYVDVSHLKQIFWIPDFQEAFLPELFTIDDIEERKETQRYICEHADTVVFSSKNAAQHFKSLYPNYNRKTLVLNFAVTHPSLEHIDEEGMRSKYPIDRPYFFAPNQFWQHKNHETLIKAVALAVIENPLIRVLLSGKEEDYRVEGHVQFLKGLVQEYKLEDHIKFLGFLPRDEQLYLLKKSIAVIQPSLFEGWSTVVEDTKAQGKFLILSDIPVHREQVQQSVSFFDPMAKNELAKYILEAQANQPLQVVRPEYAENILHFAQDFMTLTK